MVESRGGEGTPEQSESRRTVPKVMYVFGRQGSPTMTLALPFSRVEVRGDDAAPLVAELAALTARLARAVLSADASHKTQAEVVAIANAADALAFAAHDSRPER